MLAGGCGEATQKPSTIESNSISGSSSASTPKDDRKAVVEACMKFETQKVCDCIANTLETQHDTALFQKVAENARNGAVTPSGWQRGMSSTEQTKFESAMKRWNERCELN